MSSLQDHLDRYLAVRRSVGYRLEEQARVLPEFVRYAQAKGETTVRTQTAIVWAGGGSSDRQRGRRLSMVRGFARYLVAFDATTEVPPPGLHPSPVRSTPHIYTETEIARLMRARRSSPRYAGGPFAAQARDDRARDAALGQVALCGHVAAETTLGLARAARIAIAQPASCAAMNPRGPGDAGEGAGEHPAGADGGVAKLAELVKK